MAHVPPSTHPDYAPHFAAIGRVAEVWAHEQVRAALNALPDTEQPTLRRIIPVQQVQLSPASEDAEAPPPPSPSPG